MLFCLALTLLLLATLFHETFQSPVGTLNQLEKERESDPMEGIPEDCTLQEAEPGTSTSSLTDLLLRKPRLDVLEGREFMKEFAELPIVKNIDINNKEVDSTLRQFLDLDNELKDVKLVPRLTAVVDRYLRDIDAKKELIEALRGQRYVKRRRDANIRSKRIVQKRDPIKCQLRRKTYKKNVALRKKEKEKDQKDPDSSVPLEEYCGDQLDGEGMSVLDVAKKARLFSGYYDSEQEYSWALRSFLKRRNFSDSDISIATGWTAHEYNVIKRSLKRKSRIQIGTATNYQKIPRQVILENLMTSRENGGSNSRQIYSSKSIQQPNAPMENRLSLERWNKIASAVGEGSTFQAFAFSKEKEAQEQPARKHTVQDLLNEKEWWHLSRI